MPSCRGLLKSALQAPGAQDGEAQRDFGSKGICRLPLASPTSMTPGHRQGQPQCTSLLGEANLTRFCPLGMKQDRAEEEERTRLWVGSSLMSACTHRTLPGSPNDPPMVCKGPGVSVQLLQLGPQLCCSGKCQGLNPTGSTGGPLPCCVTPEQAVSSLSFFEPVSSHIK